MPLTIFERGRIWYIRGTITVGQRTASVYESTGVADQKVAEIMRAKKEAALVEELLHGKKRVATFTEAMVSYLENGGSERFLDKVHACFKLRKLASITQKELDDAARETYPNVNSDTKNRQFYTPFIAVWNHAVAEEWAEPRKWLRARTKTKGTTVVKLKGRRAGTHPVEYERAARFVEAMSPGPAMLMTALFYTGMRPIELFSLAADNVNVPGRWIVLEHTKTGEPRGVPIHEFIVPLLEPLVKRGGVLFRTWRGEAYKPKDETGGQMKTAIIGARRRLAYEANPEMPRSEVTAQMSPIRDVAPYTGRHSVSTQLVINGIHPHIKDQILGHATTDMSRHYTQVPQAPLIEAINTLPVPFRWRSLPWWEDPVKWSTRYAGNPGMRTDLTAQATSHG